MRTRIKALVGVAIATAAIGGALAAPAAASPPVFLVMACSNLQNGESINISSLRPQVWPSGRRLRL